MMGADRTSIGVGPALRRAREIRGLSIDQAVRDTRLTAGQLRSLEDEDFGWFDGQVLTRAALGSYARYLGLNPEKVVGAYARHADDPSPPPPPAKLGRVERALAAARVRDNQRFLLVAASLLLVVLVVFGILSRDHSAPDAAQIPTEPAIVPREEGTVEVVLVAIRPVDVTVSVDGRPGESFLLRTDETRALTGSDSIDLTVADGTAVRVTANGVKLGIPGTPGRAWKRTFDSRGGAASPTG